jgi:hypothetical protein
MSDRRIHRAIGTLAKSGLALAKAQRRAARRAPAITPPLQRLWQPVREILCRPGAGALAGLLGGYGSHVDAFTPAGLPLLA